MKEVSQKTTVKELFWKSTFGRILIAILRIAAMFILSLVMIYGFGRLGTYYIPVLKDKSICDAGWIIFLILAAGFLTGFVILNLFLKIKNFMYTLDLISRLPLTAEEMKEQNIHSVAEFESFLLKEFQYKKYGCGYLSERTKKQIQEYLVDAYKAASEMFDSADNSEDIDKIYRNRTRVFIEKIICASNFNLKEEFYGDFIWHEYVNDTGLFIKHTGTIKKLTY